MALNLREIVKDVKSIKGGYILAGYDFGKGEPKLIPPNVEVFATEKKIAPRPMEEILEEYNPVAAGFEAALDGYLSEDSMPPEIDITFAELFPTLRLGPGKEPRYHSFHLQLESRTGIGSRPLPGMTIYDAKGYDKIVKVFEKHGWTITNKVDDTLLGGRMRTHEGVADPRYAK